VILDANHHGPLAEPGVLSGVHRARVATEFKLDIEVRLASILPAAAGTDSEDDERRPALSH